MTETPPRAVPVETIRKALLGYRVLAWTTGIWLIALCYEIVLRYVVKVDNPPTWIGVVHGWVYFVYLLATANLAVKVRWPIGKTIGVLLAGTIPLRRHHRRALPDQGHQAAVRPLGQVPQLRHQQRQRPPTVRCRILLLRSQFGRRARRPLRR